MLYNECLDFLYNSLPIFQRQGKKAYKANLNNTILLDNRYKNPHKNYKTIHVGGTNGKGSTSGMIAEVLKNAGYKVGLYTSPHLLDFRERIQINGKKISKAWIEKFINNDIDYFKMLKPSFFELTVSMAFLYFKEQSVDYAVIEVGLGGRLDSTNIINPILSIITNISLEHTDLLGNTIEKIAKEKAGIIKKNTNIIISEQSESYNQIFKDKAKRQNSEIYFADEEFSVNNYTKYHIIDKNLETFDFNSTIALYQLSNIKACLSTIKKLNVSIDKNLIIKSINHFLTKKNYCRWQIVQQEPKIILDSAHNFAAIKKLFLEVNNLKYKKLFVIIGIVQDKAIDKILSILPKQAEYIATKANIIRAMEANDLNKELKKQKLNSSIQKSVKLAIQYVKTKATDNDLILITGSSFVAGEAKGFF